MKKLIIDQMGLEQYQQLEEVVEFYPHGIKGLVVDYITSYLKNPLGALEETEEDVQFFRSVLDLYDNAPIELRHNYGGDMSQVVMMMLVVKVAHIVRDIVLHYGTQMHNGIFDPSLIDWGQGYLLIPTRS